MKTLSPFSIILLFIFGTLLLSAQTKFQVTNIQVSNNIYFPKVASSNLSSFNIEDKKVIKQQDNVSNRVDFSQKKDKVNFGINLLIGIKKRGKQKNSKLFQEFSFGLEYKSITKNAVQFLYDGSSSSSGVDNPWWNLLLWSSTDYDYITTYEINAEILSVQVQEMFWLSDEGLLNMGIGLRGGLGYELKSTLVQKNYTKSTSSSLFSSSTSTNLNSTEKLNSKRGLILNASLPISFSLKFSRKKDRLGNKLKFISTAIFGLNQNLPSGDNSLGYFGTNFGFSLNL